MTNLGGATPAPKCVGLDLSLSASGVAMPGGTCVVKTTPAKFPNHWARLSHILDNVLALCIDADLVVVEEYAFSRTASHAHQIGELGGLVRYSLWTLGIPTAAVLPNVNKLYATGKGSSKKSAMVSAARERLGYDAYDEDIADALWLQAMGLDHLGAPPVMLPKAHRAAMNKVEWPMPFVRWDPKTVGKAA